MFKVNESTLFEAACLAINRKNKNKKNSAFVQFVQSITFQHVQWCGDKKAISVATLALN